MTLAMSTVVRNLVLLTARVGANLFGEVGFAVPVVGVLMAVNRHAAGPTHP
jgi:hypothetical protein